MAREWHVVRGRSFAVIGAVLGLAAAALVGAEPTSAVPAGTPKGRPAAVRAGLTGGLVAVAPTTSRLAGSDRVGTAVEISKHAFPQPFASGGSVYLARKDVFADAVAAGSLTDGPVLLVPSCGTVPTVVTAEVARLAPARVVALGGTGAVCDQVLADVAGSRATGRLAGANRYTTALAIAGERLRQGPAPEVYLATGADSPDAVAGGQLTRGPILLTDGTDAVNLTVRDVVSSQAKPNRVVALGGTSVVTDATLRSVANGIMSGRLAGQSRHVTAAAIAMREFREDADTVYLARGDVYADAVASGALADGPVLLVSQCSLPAAARERIAAARPQRVIALGGIGAVCDAVLTQAAQSTTLSGGRNTLVSMDSTGWNSASLVDAGTISADNRTVAWIGVGPAPNGYGVFVTDLATQVDRKVSVVGSSDLYFNDTHVTISANGRRAAFPAQLTAFASVDIYLYDSDTGVTRQISPSGPTIDGTYISEEPVISADGSKIVFSSNGRVSDVDPGPRWHSQVYLIDVASGTTTMLSRAKDGAAGDGSSYMADISPDGRWVSFVTKAANLVADSPAPEPSVVRFDTATGDMTRMSVDAAGATVSTADVSAPQISADGGRVAFFAYDGPPPHLYGDLRQVVVKDAQTGAVEVASVGVNGAPLTHRAWDFAMSDDGQLVAFGVPADPDAAPGTFTEAAVQQRDLVSHTTRPISTLVSGEPAVDIGSTDARFMLEMSADGSRILMQTTGPGLVSGIDSAGYGAGSLMLWTKLTSR